MCEHYVRFAVFFLDISAESTGHLGRTANRIDQGYGGWFHAGSEVR